ncbi:UPF0481 protein At3g47200-like [Asparagus officinalis]|uniref:UPF0481 protein At3g47200-like n=1 Tax=Asparagus officinalis TaxID=4686 RepID=UPI00098E81AB|nr:UPF0481 protein At3g47200-like [Asparagus officinalis]
MDALPKVPRNCVLPMAAVVSTAPSKTDRAIKKEEERAISITYPDHEDFSRECKLDVNDLTWMETIKKKLNESHPETYQFAQCTIFRVPRNIRRGDPKAYEPLVVSIGPYHYCSSQRGTRGSMQEHKWQCLRYLLSRHRCRERESKILERCLSQLKALDCEVRGCYSGTLEFDQHKLSSIMLLDGCFIVHILLRQVLNEEEEEIIHGPLLGLRWIWNLIVYDLLKVENQMPFFVVQILFDILQTPADKGINLQDLVLKLFHDIHPNKSVAFTSIPRNKIHHLLHLFHSTLIPSTEQIHVTTPPEWIPCASELKLAGIKFKQNEAAESFLDVSFKDGLMEIPQLRIYDYTSSVFRNLIAFEQCYPGSKTYITIYAAFMDCIIDTAEDVKLLDLKGILVNRLSTDEVVADLFNQLCNQIHYASDMNYLGDVFVKVKKYHESKWHRWRAGLIRDYFSNPWAGIAVVAAIVLFLLTIEQSIFDALSYFYPS